MAKLFLTADMHFDHEVIITPEYCKRPFPSLDAMNKRLIHNWNQRVKDEDTIIHVGDFAFRTRGTKPQHWIEQLNGHKVFVQGNHDKNNGLKTHIKHLILDFAGEEILVTHQAEQETMPSPMFRTVLCGHSHDKWKYRLYKWGNVKTSVINVGTDAWDFFPQTINELIDFRNKIKRENSF